MVSLFQLRSFGTQSPTTTPSTIEMMDGYILPPIFPERNPDNRPRQVVEDGPTPLTSVTTAETDENTSTTEEMGTSTVVPITTEDDENIPTTEGSSTEEMSTLPDENIPTTEGSTTEQISTSHDEDSSTTEGLTTVEMSRYTLLNILTTRIIDQGVDEATKTETEWDYGSDTDTDADSSNSSDERIPFPDTDFSDESIPFPNPDGKMNKR